MSSSTPSAEGVVALFNASDDTIDMIDRLLLASGHNQTLIWCHFADLKKGVVNFGEYVAEWNPEVVISTFPRRTMRTGDSSRGCTTMKS